MLVAFLVLRGDASLTVMGIGCQGMPRGCSETRGLKDQDRGAWGAVNLDLVCVIGSYALLFALRFSSGGKWAIVLVGELAFLFGNK
jgi:hypothetical protein